MLTPSTNTFLADPFLQTLKFWGSAQLPLCPHVPNTHHFSPDSNPFYICYPRPHLPPSIRLPPFSHLLGVFGALSSLHPLTALTPNTHQATTNQANRRVLRHRCGEDSEKHRQRGRDRKRHGAWSIFCQRFTNSWSLVTRENFSVTS